MRVAVIQARMGSSRLPGKVLRLLAGEPMLGRIVQRVAAAESVDAVIVATSDRPQDDVLAEFCASRSIDCFRGSETDVLDRFWRAAAGKAAESVLRITADCPCADPAVIDTVYRMFREGGLDHASVSTGAGAALSQEFRWPDGLDAEWMSFPALKKAADEATDSLDREHVTPYLWRHPLLFRTASLAAPEDYSQFRLTVDNEEDFQLIARIYQHFAPNALFGLEDILMLLRQQPELAALNRAYIGTEGYQQFHCEPASHD
jgi:spore coat polysaccharide biosynthesis protein SpsF